MFKNKTDSQRKLNVNVLIRCRFDFNFRDMGFVLIEISLKQVKYLYGYIRKPLSSTWGKKQNWQLETRHYFISLNI